MRLERYSKATDTKTVDGVNVSRLKAHVYVFICPIYNRALVYENCTEVLLLQVDSELESGPLLGIATLYGLDGRGIESQCGYFPHPSIPAMAPTQTFV
jgi:hypothetical protein